MMLAARAAWFALFSSVLVACGGSSRPGRTPSGAGGESAGGESAEGGKSVEQIHSDFLRACAKDASMNEFCGCRWTVVSTELTAAELSKGKATADHIENARARIRAECSDKLAEPPIKSAFIHGCMQADEARRPICECVWPELRKTFTLADFADDETLKSARLQATLHASVKVCAAKSGDGVARIAFMNACAEKPAFGPFCACAWKALRAKLTVDQIAHESDPPTPRFKAAAQSARSACADLRPGN